MTDLDKIVYFSCPDECGQVAVPCSIRMILDDESFYCEACGCEFQGADFPDWLSNITPEACRNKPPEYGIMAALYSYLHAGGDVPPEGMLSQLLEADRKLWKRFPPEKLAPADMLALLDDEEFVSRLDCSRLNGAQLAALISSRPDFVESRSVLEHFCRWNELTSPEWAKLLTAAPDSPVLVGHCNWRTISLPDLEKIARTGKNRYAAAVRHVRTGTEIAPSVKKFPDVEKYIEWTKIAIPEWLDLLAEFPRFAARCPWDKMYVYIAGLPAEQRTSIRTRSPRLWEKRSEILRHADLSALLKLPAEKYYTVLDFFDWEESFNYAALSRRQRVELFAKHPQFGERFGWDNIPSDEKINMAVGDVEFAKYYGWGRFTEDELFKILKRKREYLQYIDLKKIKRSLRGRLISLDERLAAGFELNFFDYMLFRKFDSKKLCSKITFLWHFVISIATFAGIGYLMYDGPCGFKAFWSESHANALAAAAVYFALALLWSFVHAWVFSGRTPFFLTIVSGISGATIAAAQFFYTFFLSKISLSNYICCGAALLVVLVFIIDKTAEGEIATDNLSGLRILGVFYLPLLLLTFVLCHPLCRWQYLRISGQLEKSSRPFESARRYYLRKALNSDPKAKAASENLKSATRHNTYEACKELFDKIPPVYFSLPEIKLLKEKLPVLRQNQRKKYAQEAIAAYNEGNYGLLRARIGHADTENAEIQFILGKCFQLGLAGYKVDFAEAAEWYRKAAEQKHLEAMNALGMLYLKGKGVAKSPGKAFLLCKSAAEGGCAAAQRNLAELYRLGTGVRKDERAAYAWYLKAARQNDPVAQRQVALMSYSATGTSRNDGEILFWMRKAAAQNDTVAQRMLGAFYLAGSPGVKDYDAAVPLLSKAAEKNDAVAQTLLGLCYAYGKGVKKDAKHAVFWLSKAAGQNDADAQYLLFETYYSGELLPQNMAKAVEWLKKAAEKKPDAQYTLGMFFRKGEGVEKNYERAEYWLNKALANGYPKAKEALEAIQKERRLENERQAGIKSKEFFQQKKYKEALQWGLQASLSDLEVVCNIALMYYKGWGTERDVGKAFKYAKIAAEGNSARGAYLLAWCYDNSRNMREAFKYYRKSAEMGLVEGQYDVGCCYLFGHGCRQDYAQAHHWFSLAAEKNFADAENNLGHMYLNGDGVKRDVNTAKKWLRRAAAHGSEAAKRALYRMW